MKNLKPELILKRLGIDTYKEAIIYMREDSHVCRAEGFEVQTRVLVTGKRGSIIATLNTVRDGFLSPGEVGLSEYAWEKVKAKEGESVTVEHAAPVKSLSFVRSKVYGNEFKGKELDLIMEDIVKGRYSDIHISSFLTACAGGKLTKPEILSLTRAMVARGQVLDWGKDLVVDKHCVGGLPGNRTTPIVVAIVAAHGLTIPKTSSRSITSPAGTADTMEVLTRVELNLEEMKQVVEKEGACMVWGGSAFLSPADDLLIRVEKALDLDSEGQLVASILSKKIAAGSSHILLDIPVGETAKVRSLEKAENLARYLEEIGIALGVEVRTHISDGSHPIGRGVGPALEARDVLSVLKNEKGFSSDLKKRSLDIAGHILEFSSHVKAGEGRPLAARVLESGRAYEKFRSICLAQGAFREVPEAKFKKVIESRRKGVLTKINNRKVANVAKLAGAPRDKTAGIDLHVKLGDKVEMGEALFTLHADTKGQLLYAFEYMINEKDIFRVEEV